MDAKTAGPRELTDRELATILGCGSTPHFDIESILSIGSQSSGAGAGKITFNPFSITRTN